MNWKCLFTFTLFTSVCRQCHVVYLPGYQNEHIGCSESILVHKRFKLTQIYLCICNKMQFYKYAEHCDTPSIGSTTL